MNLGAHIQYIYCNRLWAHNDVDLNLNSQSMTALYSSSIIHDVFRHQQSVVPSIFDLPAPTCTTSFCCLHWHAPGFPTSAPKNRKLMPLVVPTINLVIPPALLYLPLSHTYTHIPVLLHQHAASEIEMFFFFWAAALSDVWGWECMIRGRKRLHCCSSGERKPLSLSQEMALCDLLRAAAPSCLPGESDPVVTVCTQCYIKMGCNVTHQGCHKEARAKQPGHGGKQIKTHCLEVLHFNLATTATWSLLL